MTTFNEREAAFERTYVHEQDLLFQAKARRTRALAEWAGRLLRKSGPDLAAYRERMIGIQIGEGDEALCWHLLDDLEAAGQALPMASLREKLRSMLAEVEVATTNF